MVRPPVDGYNPRALASVSSPVYVDNHGLSKKGGKDQESIQSSTTPDPGYHMGK